MFEKFERFEQQPRTSEEQLPKEIEKRVGESLLDWFCRLQNALSEHEARMSLAQHEGNESELRVCRIEKELLEKGINFVRGLGREKGVNLP